MPSHGASASVAVNLTIGPRHLGIIPGQIGLEVCVSGINIGGTTLWCRPAGGSVAVAVAGLDDVATAG